jgi:hypothetical protein
MRRYPKDKRQREEQAERAFEKETKRFTAPIVVKQDGYYDDMRSVQPSLPPRVEALRQEAEAVVNSRAVLTMEKTNAPMPFSVQTPATDEPTTGGPGLLWWTGGTMDSYIPLHEYGDTQRQADLRAFALVAPFILNAESILTKKAQSLQWTIEGGRNQVKKWQERLNNLENGDGWDMFIGRWVRAYCESDRGGYAELIRAAPSWALDKNGQLTKRGEAAVKAGHDAAWEIVDARVMDPVNCFPTTSYEFPLQYRNGYTGMIHYLRQHQFMTLVDLPGVDDKYPHSGLCAVSRAVWMAQEDRMITRYSMEAMSENPGAGIMIGNVAPNLFRSALKAAEAEKEARGVVYYKGVIFLPVLDPSGRISLQFIPFAHLPEGFDRQTAYSIAKEVVATAFGLDALEFGSIPGRLGTALQSEVAAEKSRGKSIGAIMQGVERNFRYKMLPEGLNFSIKKQDLQERAAQASIDAQYFKNAVDYAALGVPPQVVVQYLAYKGAIPNQYPFITADLTPRQTVEDVAAIVPPEMTGPEMLPEAEAPGPAGTQVSEAAETAKRYYEPRVKMNRDGEEEWQSMPPIVGGQYASYR